MRAGIKIQFFTFYSLVLQSFILPLILGLENYGFAIYSFTYCLLVAAVFEPFSQHGSSIKDVKSANSYVIFFLIFLSLLIFFIQSLLYLLNIFDLSFLFLSSLSGVLFLISIYMQARAYSAGLISEIARALFFSTLAFSIVLGATYWFRIERGEIYFYSFIVMQGVLACSVFFLCYRKLDFNLSFSLKDVNFFSGALNILYESISWRSFFILFTLLYVWFVGRQYGMQAAGELKFILSCILGARYLYPVNAPMFHELTNNDLRKSIKFLTGMFFYFFLIMVGIVVFGEFFVKKISVFDDFNFVFSSPWYFIGAPVLLCSMAMGSIYVRLGIPAFALGSSILAFCISISLLSYSLDSGIAFFGGSLAFIILFILSLVWRLHAYPR